MARLPSPTKLDSTLAKKRPRSVSRVLTKIGTDSTGDPAVWIWIILKDASLPRAWSFESREKLRQWAKQTVRSAGIEDLTYVSFRTESEQQELERSPA